MMTTIELSPYISVQGLVVSRLPNGDVKISVCGREFTGRPISVFRSECPDPTVV